ncbi:hypothetical protein V8F06_002271 [Rhypophila decipiens]
MAAVDTPPPVSPTSTSSPSRRKPVPLRGLASIERFGWDENAAKPLPGVPTAESPKLRESPVSPVKLNFLSKDLPQPSNANIEIQRPLEYDPRERALPKTPEAPTPPPHTPLDDQTPLEEPMPRIPGLKKVLGGFKKKRSSELRQDRLAASLPSPGYRVSQLPDDASISGELSRKGDHRHSRESDTTASTQQKTSTESSATTSASSVSGILEPSDGQDKSFDESPENSIVLDDATARTEMVPQLQYHHSAFLPRPVSLAMDQDPRAQSNPNLAETGASINRRLTPSSMNFMRRSSLPRPQSSYTIYSDSGLRGRSPGLHGGAHNRAPSTHSARRSPDTRPSSTYAELLNIPYPQPAPAPLSFDNSQLRAAVGSNASLLSAQKTLEMYRKNLKKTNDSAIQYSFALSLISTAQEQGPDPEDHGKATKRPSSRDGPRCSSPSDLIREARAILQKLSNNGYPFAQYYLADGYASGLFSKGKEDYNSAFPLFVLAAKHGHAESAYRTALCYEFGWGCRKDPARAVQFLRTAAARRHPGAMTRLGKACLSGDLGELRYKEGIKWLKLATEASDAVYNAAPYHLACLFETGYGDEVFKDESYAAELFTLAADLGHPEANFRMGDAYEHGKLNCPRDPALSVHFYTGAAERGHAGAMMGLCAWYMVGADPILAKDEEEAYEWARRAAELGNVKAQYAVGYFTETGIGCRRDILEANVWYVKAADAGDIRATQRLAVIRAAVSGGKPMDVAHPRNHKIKKSASAAEKDDEKCRVM